MPYLNNKLAFIDLETTGLEPEHHEILEIGLVLAEQSLSPDKKIALNVLEEWDVKVKPKHIENADLEGLKINKYSPADWLFAVDLPKALEALSGKTADAIMVGHNVSFDFAFLEKGFEQTGIPNKMHYHKLDTISIAFAKLYTHEDMEKLSLRALCEYLGVENKKAHSALSDARATYEVFLKLMAL